MSPIIKRHELRETSSGYMTVSVFDDIVHVTFSGRSCIAPRTTVQMSRSDMLAAGKLFIELAEGMDEPPA